MEFKTDLQKVTRIEDANAAPLTPENYLGLRDLFYPEEYNRYAPRTRDIKKWFEFRNGEAWLAFRNPEAWDMIIGYQKERPNSLLFDGFPERWADRRDEFPDIIGPEQQPIDMSPLDLIHKQTGDYLTDEFVVTCSSGTVAHYTDNVLYFTGSFNVLNWGISDSKWIFGESIANSNMPAYYVDIEAYQDISPAIIHKL